MASISSLKEIKKGLVLVYNNEPCLVLAASFLRMQQRKPVMQTKLKGLQSGKSFEYSFKQGESIETADLERKSVNFLYFDGTNYVFMDNQTYDQLSLPAETVGEKADYLVADTTLDLLLWDGQIVSLDLPIKINLKVVEAEPGVRGDTAQGSVTKPAKLESGATIQVPIFVKEGDVVRVNTEKGEYVERVN
jgi:elongation factor P